MLLKLCAAPGLVYVIKTLLCNESREHTLTARLIPLSLIELTRHV